jgi:hypothetical protein
MCNLGFKVIHETKKTGQHDDGTNKRETKEHK